MKGPASPARAAGCGRLAAAALLALCCAAAAAGVPASVPPPLARQVERLAALLQDRHASWYPDATLVQEVRLPGRPALALVVFTVEGFGGGNSHAQHLAVFEVDRDGAPAHYTLVDVLHVGGKGWRAVERLAARVTPGPRGRLALALDVVEVGPQDAPNFPSRPAVLRLVLRDGRLVEERPGSR